MPENLDIYPEHIFFVYDIVITDDTVDSSTFTKFEGLFVKVDKVLGANILIYSYDSKIYYGKLTKMSFEIDPKNNKDGIIRGSIEKPEKVFNTKSFDTIEKCQNLSMDTKKRRILSAFNHLVIRESSYSNKGLFDSILEGKRPGFKGDREEPITVKIGDLNKLLAFLYRIKTAVKPWRILEELEQKVME